MTGDEDAAAKAAASTGEREVTQDKRSAFTLKQALTDLLKVRSLITLIVIGVTSYLAIMKIIEAATYMTLAGTVVTYYFSRKEQ